MLKKKKKKKKMGLHWSLEAAPVKYHFFSQGDTSGQGKDREFYLLACMGHCMYAVEFTGCICEIIFF